MKKNIVRRNIPQTDLLLNDDLHPILKNIYLSRGVKSSAELEKSLKHLLNYQDLSGIEKAARYLAEAVMQQQRILIVGDFDADGATSTAVAVSALRAMGSQNVNFLVPNRFEYGYGLTPEIVAVAAKLKPDLIVTVDNGISSHAGVEAAKAHGIKVIVTDHHLVPDVLPEADAIVNPHLPHDKFASKCMAGVGVIFYVMLAVRSELRTQGWFASTKIEEPNMAQFLDLVALGTVADLVPLDHNNRILVYQGIARIRAGKARPGISALLTIAGRSHTRLTAADLGFAIAPRLNAAGRLTDMSLGIECLLSQDPNRAREIAVQLNSLNEERRAIEQTMQTQAFSDLESITRSQTSPENLAFGLCLFDESWHQGVIGLLASRVKDAFHRPVIAFAPSNENELKGSARSIRGLHLRDALAAIATRFPEILNKFGGHAMAAGLTIHRDHYHQFAKLFDEEVRRVLKPSDLNAEIHSDGELTSTQFHLNFAEVLREGGPWGQAFPEPLFDGKFTVISRTIVGGKHLKLCLGGKEITQPLDAILFNPAQEIWDAKSFAEAHIAYRLDINEYLGSRKLQLIVEHLEPVFD